MRDVSVFPVKSKSIKQIFFMIFFSCNVYEMCKFFQKCRKLRPSNPIYSIQLRFHFSNRISTLCLQSNYSKNKQLKKKTNYHSTLIQKQMFNSKRNITVANLLKGKNIDRNTITIVLSL